MNSAWKVACLLCALQIGLTSSAHASLLNDEVDVLVDHLNVAFQGPIGTSPDSIFATTGRLVADPGIEVTGEFGFQFDFNADSIHITLNPVVELALDSLTFGANGPIQVTFPGLFFAFTDLDPRNPAGVVVPGARISGVVLVTDLSADTRASFSNNGVALFLENGIEVSSDMEMTLNLTFAFPDPAEAPAPSTLALFACVAFVPLHRMRGRRA